MQVSQTPLVVTPSTANTSIQGDAATRRFGIFFLSALAVVTIGAGVGIGVGNIAHYRYYSPNNNTNISSEALYNLTAYALPIQEKTKTVSVPVNSHIKRRAYSRLWLSKELSSLNDQNNEQR